MASSSRTKEQHYCTKGVKTGIHFLHVKPLPSPLPWRMPHRSSSSYMKIKSESEKKKKVEKNLSAIALLIKQSHLSQYIGKKVGFGFVFKSDFKFLSQHTYFKCWSLNVTSKMDRGNRKWRLILAMSSEKNKSLYSYFRMQSQFILMFTGVRPEEKQYKSMKSLQIYYSWEQNMSWRILLTFLSRTPLSLACVPKITFRKYCLFISQTNGETILL